MSSTTFIGSQHSLNSLAASSCSSSSEALGLSPLPAKDPLTLTESPKSWPPVPPALASKIEETLDREISVKTEHFSFSFSPRELLDKIFERCKASPHYSLGQLEIVGSTVNELLSESYRSQRLHEIGLEDPARVTSQAMDLDLRLPLSFAENAQRKAALYHLRDTVSFAVLQLAQEKGCRHIGLEQISAEAFSANSIVLKPKEGKCFFTISLGDPNEGSIDLVFWHESTARSYLFCADNCRLRRLDKASWELCSFPSELPLYQCLVDNAYGLIHLDSVEQMDGFAYPALVARSIRGLRIVGNSCQEKVLVDKLLQVEQAPAMIIARSIRNHCQSYDQAFLYFMQYCRFLQRHKVAIDEAKVWHQLRYDLEKKPVQNAKFCAATDSIISQRLLSLQELEQLFTLIAALRLGSGKNERSNYLDREALLLKLPAGQLCLLSSLEEALLSWKRLFSCQELWAPLEAIIQELIPAPRFAGYGQSKWLASPLLSCSQEKLSQLIRELAHSDLRALRHLSLSLYAKSQELSEYPRLSDEPLNLWRRELLGEQDPKLRLELLSCWEKLLELDLSAAKAVNTEGPGYLKTQVSVDFARSPHERLRYHAYKWAKGASLKTQQKVLEALLCQDLRYSLQLWAKITGKLSHIKAAQYLHACLELYRGVQDSSQRKEYELSLSAFIQSDAALKNTLPVICSMMSKQQRGWEALELLFTLLSAEERGALRAQMLQVALKAKKEELILCWAKDSANNHPSSALQFIKALPWEQQKELLVSELRDGEGAWELCLKSLANERFCLSGECEALMKEADHLELYSRFVNLLDDKPAAQLRQSFLRNCKASDAELDAENLNLLQEALGTLPPEQKRKELLELAFAQLKFSPSLALDFFRQIDQPSMELRVAFFLRAESAELLAQELLSDPEQLTTLAKWLAERPREHERFFARLLECPAESQVAFFCAGFALEAPPQEFFTSFRKLIPDLRKGCIQRVLKDSSLAPVELISLVITLLGQDPLDADLCVYLAELALYQERPSPVSFIEKIISQDAEEARLLHALGAERFLRLTELEQTLTLHVQALLLNTKHPYGKFFTEHECFGPWIFFSMMQLNYAYKRSPKELKPHLKGLLSFQASLRSQIEKRPRHEELYLQFYNLYVCLCRISLPHLGAFECLEQLMKWESIIEKNIQVKDMDFQFYNVIEHCIQTMEREPNFNLLHPIKRILKKTCPLGWGVDFYFLTAQILSSEQQNCEVAALLLEAALKKLADCPEEAQERACKEYHLTATLVIRRLLLDPLRSHRKLAISCWKLAYANGGAFKEIFDKNLRAEILELLLSNALAEGDPEEMAAILSVAMELSEPSVSCSSSSELRGYITDLNGGPCYWISISYIALSLPEDSPYQNLICRQPEEAEPEAEKQGDSYWTKMLCTAINRICSGPTATQHWKIFRCVGHRMFGRLAGYVSEKTAGELCEALAQFSLWELSFPDSNKVSSQTEFLLLACHHRQIFSRNLPLAAYLSQLYESTQSKISINFQMARKILPWLQKDLLALQAAPALQHLGIVSEKLINDMLKKAKKSQHVEIFQAVVELINALLRENSIWPSLRYPTAKVPVVTQYLKVLKQVANSPHLRRQHKELLANLSKKLMDRVKASIELRKKIRLCLSSTPSPWHCPKITISAPIDKRPVKSVAPFVQVLAQSSST